MNIPEYRNKRTPKRDDDHRHNHNIFEILINTSENKAYKNNKNKLESDNDIHKKIFIHQEKYCNKKSNSCCSLRVGARL